MAKAEYLLILATGALLLIEARCVFAMPPQVFDSGSVTRGGRTRQRDSVELTDRIGLESSPSHAKLTICGYCKEARVEQCMVVPTKQETVCRVEPLIVVAGRPRLKVSRIKRLHNRKRAHRTS